MFIHNSKYSIRKKILLIQSKYIFVRCCNCDIIYKIFDQLFLLLMHLKINILQYLMMMMTKKHTRRSHDLDNFSSSLIIIIIIALTSKLISNRATTKTHTALPCMVQNKCYVATS